ncbi:hypothetical protein HRbin09_01964 [bacterium HR09]|nr:hypothetical protein HRbin09_01964 [bacterium HR09]
MSRSLEESTCKSSTLTSTSALDLSLAAMSRSAMATLSAVSRITSALSCSLVATRRASMRVRIMLLMSFTSALDKKNVFTTRSS